MSFIIGLLCVVSFFCWGLTAITVSALADEKQQTIAVEGGTLIDGTGSTAVPWAVILVENDRIRAVGKCGAVPFPRALMSSRSRGSSSSPV